MFKLVAFVKHGVPNDPRTSIRFNTLDEARSSARELLHDDERVLRISIVKNEIPPRFVEWVER